MKKTYHNILILNGPNLNLLGIREPSVYGTQTFDSFFTELKEEYSNLNLAYKQSNSEGILIDLIQEYGLNNWAIILNAGAYTHTSIAIRDAISAIPESVVELHISDITKREAFRQHSYLKDVCEFHVMGIGLDGYKLAIDFLSEKMD